MDYDDAALSADRSRDLPAAPSGPPDGAVAPPPVDGGRGSERRGPVAVRIAQLPSTRQEIYALERACLKAAKASGYRGRKAKTEAARIYNAAIEEAQRVVREPETQAS